MVDNALRPLGRRPKVEGKPVLRLASFLGTSRPVPVHPAAEDDVQAVQWGLDGNDRYGVCVPTGKDNAHRTVSLLLTGKQVSMTQSQIFADYRIQNPKFDPNTGADDNGMVIQDYLAAKVKSGDILGFAAVDVSNDDELTAAEYLFQGTLWGVDLQTAQQSQSVWDYRRSGEWGGHCVWVPAYSADDRQTAITWAERVPTTDAFRRHQLDEAYVLLFPEHVANPTFRAGFDLAGFAQAFTDITGRPFPVDVPPSPAPTPAPEPTPTPDPGAASFLDDDPELAARVDHAAARARLTREAWLLKHLRSYFGIKV